MAISRRNFLRKGALTATISGLALKTAAGSTTSAAEAVAPVPVAPVGMAALYTRETFSRHVNTKFTIMSGTSKAVRLTLKEVVERKQSASKHAHAGRQCDCFALVFRADRGEKLGQDTYSFEHSALGEFSLFIVPEGLSRRGATYEAVINRLQ